MSKVCGKLEISPRLFKRLFDLGQAIDQQQQLSVFDGGLVGFDYETESEVIQHVAQREAQGSSARSRSRWRKPSDARRRPSGSRHHIGSEAHERVFGAEFRLLALHYEALAFEDKQGLWITASSHPLGWAGPQVHFLVGVLSDRRFLPRAWAFRNIGRRTETFPLKHTNFPDATVCAFTKQDEAWVPEAGLVAFFDHLTVWAIKSFHREVFGWWPGPQYGFGALYRRREFHPDEWCGCQSGKRYRFCHQAIDLLADEGAARSEFARAFGGPYEKRAYPKEIIEAAQSRWKSLPTLRQVFQYRSLKVEC